MYLSMNTRRKIALSILFLGYLSHGYANVGCISYPGRLTCNSSKSHNLSGNGNVRINRTAVSGVTKINGYLSAKASLFNTLMVNGSATLVQCTVKATTQINGSLFATSTHFKGNLSVKGEKIYLINSKLSGNLHLLHTAWKKQTVVIDKHSDIVGTIIFDDGHGEVIVQGNSNIKGQVIGGHLILK